MVETFMFGLIFIFCFFPADGSLKSRTDYLVAGLIAVAVVALAGVIMPLIYIRLNGEFILIKGTN